MVSGQRQWEAKFPTRFFGFSDSEELSKSEPNHNLPFVLESEFIVETLQNNLKLGFRFRLKAFRETEHKSCSAYVPGSMLNRGSSLTPRVRSRAARLSALMRGSGPEVAYICEINFAMADVYPECFNSGSSLPPRDETRARQGKLPISRSFMYGP